MAGGAPSASRFDHLLDVLKEQHEQELNELRNEVQRLQGHAPPRPNLKKTVQWHGVTDNDELPPSWNHLRISDPDNWSSKNIQGSRELGRRAVTQMQGGCPFTLKHSWSDAEAHLILANGDCDCYALRESRNAKASVRPWGVKDDSSWFYRLANPNGMFRTTWAMIGLGMVLVDLVLVPLQVYDLPHNIFLGIVDWVTLFYWTFDMAMAFFCGYYEGGELVMDLRRMVFRYLRTWFFLDFLIVCPEWLQVLSSGGSDASSWGRLLRGARIMRVLRLLRIMKLQRMIHNLYDLIDNEYSFILAELVKMMTCIIGLNHIIACGWFLVGKTAASFSMTTWVSWTENFLEMGIGYQYTTSLHWTLTQFTPASMDVVARNIIERIYSIIVLLFAMVAFSSIVGTVTTSMTMIRQMKDDKQKQFWKLRRYLNQRSVSNDLAKRMIRFVEYQTSKQEKTIQAPNVLMLKRISEQLASELAYEMHMPVLNGHALFRYLSREMKGMAFRICHSALNAKQVALGDTLFLVGEEASLAFIVKSGDFTYTHKDGRILDPPIEEQEWLAEAVLWTQWRYRGCCKACAPSEILALDAKQFMEAMCTHPTSLLMAKRYGQRFVRLINIGVPLRWSDVLREEDFRMLAIKEGPECEEWLFEQEEQERITNLEEIKPEFGDDAEEEDTEAEAESADGQQVGHFQVGGSSSAAGARKMRKTSGPCPTPKRTQAAGSQRTRALRQMASIGACFPPCAPCSQ